MDIADSHDEWDSEQDCPKRRDSSDVRMYKVSMTYREINISAQDKHKNAKTAEDHLWHRYERNWTGAHYTDFFFFLPKKLLSTNFQLRLFQQNCMAL